MSLLFDSNHKIKNTLLPAIPAGIGIGIATCGCDLPRTA